jgi:hypothetical protein
VLRFPSLSSRGGACIDLCISCYSMSMTVGTGNTAPALTAVGVVLFIWALIAYLIRLYVKLWKSSGLGVDDGAITMSLVRRFSSIPHVT